MPLPALQDSLFYSAATPASSTASSPSPKRRAVSAARTPERSTMSSPHASPSSSSRVRTQSRGNSKSSASSKQQRKRTTGSSSGAGITADKFKLHFAGRVYRPLDYASPEEARKMYTTSGDWLGQPDEMVDPDQEDEQGSETRCICGIGPNSSLMIQCEDCETWQHAECMGFASEEDCPETYFCRECIPNNGKAKSGSSLLEGPWTSNTTMDQLRDPYERACTPPPQPELLRNRAELQRTPDSHRSTAKSSVMLGSSDIDSDDGLEVTPSSPSVRDLHASGSESGSRSSLPRPPYWSPTASPSSSRSPAARALAQLGETPSKSAAYAASRQLLAQTSAASPLVRAGPSHPLLTPSKSAKRAAASTAPAGETEQVTPTKGSKGSAKKQDDEVDHSTIPLPEHYTALLALHSAVERALLLHLATEGSRAGALVASGNTEAIGSDELQVDLPNLITYNQIRAVVERGAGKRFGPLELGQLVWLWEGGLDGARASEDDAADLISEHTTGTQGRRGGLSLSVQATRQLDKTTGKKVYTWGIGLDLRLKQNVQLPAFEVLNSGADAPSTPGRSGSSTAGDSPNSAGRMLKRQGMSVLPLWSNKAESRKLEMRRRLGQCVAKAHDDFLATSVADSPSKKRRVHFDESYTLPAPPIAKADRKESPFKPGFILDALPPIPSATLPHLGPARSSPLKRSANATGSSSSSPSKLTTIASVDAATASADTDKQVSTSEKRKQLKAGEKASSALSGPRITPEKRQSSLMERIKAKEAERLAALASDAASAGAQGKVAAVGTRAVAQSTARNSLEAASLRAKKRQGASRAL